MILNVLISELQDCKIGLKSIIQLCKSENLDYKDIESKDWIHLYKQLSYLWNVSNELLKSNLNLANKFRTDLYYVYYYTGRSPVNSNFTPNQSLISLLTEIDEVFDEILLFYRKDNAKVLKNEALTSKLDKIKFNLINQANGLNNSLNDFKTDYVSSNQVFVATIIKLRTISKLKDLITLIKRYSLIFDKKTLSSDVHGVLYKLLSTYYGFFIFLKKALDTLNSNNDSVSEETELFIISLQKFISENPLKEQKTITYKEMIILFDGIQKLLHEFKETGAASFLMQINGNYISSTGTVSAKNPDKIEFSITNNGTGGVLSYWIVLNGYDEKEIKGKEIKGNLNVEKSEKFTFIKDQSTEHKILIYAKRGKLSTTFDLFNKRKIAIVQID